MIKRKLILVAGIPGVGKTTLGNFLAEHYGYLHVDMEEEHRSSRIIKNPQEFISNIFSGTSNIIATWGFRPDQETVDIVNTLHEKYGFNIFWFDGDHALARKAVMGRPDFNEQILDNQMNALAVWNVPQKINAKVIDVFDKSGNFRSFEDMAKEIGAI